MQTRFHPEVQDILVSFQWDLILNMSSIWKQAADVESMQNMCSMQSALCGISEMKSEHADWGGSSLASVSGHWIVHPARFRVWKEAVDHIEVGSAIRGHACSLQMAPLLREEGRGREGENGGGAWHLWSKGRFTCLSKSNEDFNIVRANLLSWAIWLYNAMFACSVALWNLYRVIYPYSPVHASYIYMPQALARVCIWSNAGISK